MSLSNFLETKIIVLRIVKRLKGLTALDTIKLLMCMPIVYILLKLIFKIFKNISRCCFSNSPLIASFKLMNINRVICRISKNLQFVVRPKDIGITTPSFEQEVRGIFKPKPGGVVIDVGAHIGFYTIMAAKMVGKEGLVIALEPDAENFKLLMLNVRLNNLNNVIVLPYAASDKNEKILLHRSLEPDRHSIARIPPGFAGDVEVYGITIDNIVNKLGLRNIDWIKIDVEGAEHLVLKGARKTLSLAKNIIIEVWYENLNKVFSVLRKKNYDIKVLSQGKYNMYIYAKKCGRKEIDNISKIL